MLGGGAPARPRPPMPQQNMARPPARPPMGGMPTIGASNMNRMADGGIVGYAGPDGSLVQGEPTPTLGAVPPSAVGDEQIKQFAAQYTALQAGLAAATTPEDKAQSQQLMQALIRDMGNQHATVMQYIDSTKGFTTPSSQMARGGIARGGIIGYAPGGDVMIDTKYGSPDSAAFLANRDAERAVTQGKATAKSDLLRTLSREEARRFASLVQELGNQDQALSIIAEERKRPDVGNVAGIARMLAGQKESPFRVQGMEEVEEATPTITEYRPELDGPLPVGGNAAEELNVEPATPAPVTAPVAPQEFTPDALDLLAEEKLKAALNADPNEVATTRGDRLRELTGFDDLMARRIESEKAVRAQKESRLTPEETRKRRVREGLARLAEQGLGGFGAGRTSEMDKIAAERLGIEETSLADLNSLIAEKRAMGMTLFEAENSARAEIQGSQDNAAVVAGRRGDTRRTAFANSQEKGLARLATAEQNRLNRESNERVAALQVAGSNETDLVRRLNIRRAEIKEANPELSTTEIASRAMNMLDRQETSAALARVGIQAEQQDFARYEGAARIVIDRLANDIKWATLSAVDQQAAYQTALDAEMKNIEKVLKGTPSIGPAVGTESGGVRFKGGDPADRNNWQEI